MLFSIENAKKKSYFCIRLSHYNNQVCDVIFLKISYTYSLNISIYNIRFTFTYIFG